MRDGANRVDIDYVWPQTLRFPSGPTKLVYLDLNHWISLSKALAGHRDGRRYRDDLDGILSAIERKAAAFPISDSIFMESSKIRQHRQRRDLRKVIELVSQFMVVMDRSIISTHEIEALLDRLIGSNPHPIDCLDYLDWGVIRAFGRMGGLKIFNKHGEDVTTEFRLKYPGGPNAFDRFAFDAELKLNRNIIEGPSTPEEEIKLRKLGYKQPSDAIRIAERRAVQEIEQVQRFNDDPRWRRGRIRDVMTTREILIEINESLSRGLLERGIEPASFDSIIPRVEEARRAFDSMPSFDVAVTLKTAYHRNPRHQWTPNDIHDIDALGSTLPYCDIVVTDTAVASHVKQAKLPERLNTIVLSGLSEMLEHL